MKRVLLPLRGGYSLAEVMVALTLIAASAGVLLPVTFTVAVQTRQTTAGDYRTSVLSTETDHLSIAPYETLVHGETCHTFPDAVFPHTRCVTVTELDSARKRIAIVVTPEAGYGVGADSVIIERSRSGRYNPLNP